MTARPDAAHRGPDGRPGARSHGIPEERVLEDVILAPHARKRLVEPEEVADVVHLLAGPSGEAFTGAPVIMDMGWSAR